MADKEKKMPRDPKYVEPGGNVTSIAIIQEMNSWPKVDLTEPKQVQKRIDAFFNLMAKYDSKPLVSGMAHALGMDRFRFYELVRGYKVAGHPEVTDAVREVVKDAYEALETAWEYNFANGKMNPVTGIFLGRNHFGYQDRSEVIVTAADPLGETGDRKEIIQRYLESIVKE